MGWGIVVEAIGKLFTVGLSLAESLGQRDAYIAACDATLAAGRARTDADLAAKHRDDPTVRR